MYIYVTILFLSLSWYSARYFIRISAGYIPTKNKVLLCILLFNYSCKYYNV